jgi:hypothetical protein
LGQHDAKTIEDWTSILDLSTKWEFLSLRKEAIYQLSHIASPIDRLALSHRFNVVSWRVPAFEIISKRPTPLTAGEASRLPIDDVTNISALREYNTSNSRKFHALLSTLGMHPVSHPRSPRFVA